MKRFHFTLESVLQLRTRKEELAQKAHADAVRALQVAKATTAGVRQELAASWQSTREKLAAGVPAWTLEQTRGYAAGLQQKLKQAEIRERAAFNTAAVCLSQLLATRRDREILDKLRDKQKAGYIKTALAKEQREQDDRSGSACLFAAANLTGSI